MTEPGSAWRAARAVMAEQCTGRGPNGVVAAAAPVAAALGAEALRQGGNAYDAAVTAALAETVLLPPKCGLGGDMVALVVPAGATEPEALVAVGGAPAGLAELAAAGHMAIDGPTSVGVPAAAAGYAALAARGRFDRARHAAPAIALARDGFAWARICTVLAGESAELLRRENPGGTRYLPSGAPIEPGAVTRLPGLGEVLQEWAARGDGMLQGPVGEAIVAAVQGRGGVLAAADLAYGTAEWSACMAVEVGGHRLSATPAPTHGPSLLHALEWLGTPASARPAEVYRAVSEAVRRRTASEGTELVDGGTSMVSCADRDGTIVVVVHSNSFPRFGSGIVVDGLDLILANRAGRGFSSVPGSRNFPVAGRRPATTLHAWALVQSGVPGCLAGATPGGVNQVPWNAQLVVDLLRCHGDAGAAVVAPRWGLLPGDGVVGAEHGFEPEDLEELVGAAGRVEPAGPWGLRCAQQVVVRGGPDQALLAAVDPRTVGAVVAA